ncbi:hypothetical protein [uncultured Roseibium sp.]|nr:hypothetical protein [uncultured Roseibium sp.]
MAKGQKRGNREARKPKMAKKAKEAAQPTTTGLTKGVAESLARSKKK